MLQNITFDMDVSITIVSYKENLDILKRCLDSIESSTDVDYEVFVVDNANNPAVKGLLKIYERAEYIANPANNGFAAAVNQGIKQSTGEFILLLNPDTEFEPHVLKTMVDHMRKDQDVGIGSCIIRYPNGDLQDSIRRFPRMLDQIQILLKVPHIMNTRSINRYMMRDVDPLKTQKVDSIMGAFMWISKPLIEEVGLFDERYFIWFEEVDYCKMAHDAGFTIKHYGDVEIIHHKGHSFSKVATRRKQKWMRTSFRKYARKHFGVVAWLVLWALTPLFMLFGYVASAIKPM